MNQDCIFCKIVNKKIDTELLYEDDEAVAFRDINPQAPVHILIVSKEHIPRISDINKDNRQVISSMILIANKLAEDFKIKEDGYRLVFNCGVKAGQEVNHIHLHLLGGRRFKWPPG